MSDSPIEGGCLCGAVRYRLLGPALQTSLCHCEDCRRASGAPAVAWTFFRSGALEWTSGRPAEVAFAERIRSFCRDCGSPLAFHDPGIPEFFEVTTATLDDPDAHSPGDQCWTVDELPWFSGLHGLPRFDGASPLPGEPE